MATLLLAGIVLGVLAGLVRAVFEIRSNFFLDYGMHWLVLRSFLAWMDRGVLFGGLAGGGLALGATLLWGVGRSGVGSALLRRWPALHGQISTLLISAGSSIILAAVVAFFLFRIAGGVFPGSKRFLAVMIATGSVQVVSAALLFLWFSRIPERLMDPRDAGSANASGRGDAKRSDRWFKHRSLWIAAWAVLLIMTGLHGVSWWGAGRLAAGAPSILLLTVDTLRADHLSCYGYERETSPYLDRLARSGRLFERAYSHAPVTGSSFSSILTGLLPRETGTYGNGPLRTGVNTLAEYLRNAGYATGAVVSNYVLHRGKHFEDGFDDYDDRMPDREVARRLPERIGKRTTEAALAWLGAHHEEPFFFWVHYQDPHGPYTPPRSYQQMFLDSTALGRELPVNDTQSGRSGIPFYQMLEGHHGYGYYVAQYDAEIRYFDECLATLVEGLKEMGLWDRLMVVFTSDHGETMGQHDVYFAHGDDLYPELLHVPLIVWGSPDLVERGRTRVMVQSSDITPTLLSVAGLEPSIRLPGRNLLPKDPIDAIVVAETFHQDNYKCSAMGGDVALVWDRLNDRIRGYEVANDEPLDSLRQTLGVRFDSLAAVIARHRNDLDRTERSRGRLTPSEIAKLKSLGYVN